MRTEAKLKLYVVQRTENVLEAIQLTFLPLSRITHFPLCIFMFGIYLFAKV